MDGIQRNEIQERLITFEELDGQPPGDLLLIVRRLRPEWFRATTGPARGPQGRQETETPAVHVDGRLAGNSEVLTALEVTDVQEIRFRSAADASVLYDYPVGLIEVNKVTEALKGAAEFAQWTSPRESFGYAVRASEERCA